MTTNLITATLSPDEVAEILESLEAIRQKLSFLVGLSPIERRRIAKMGHKSQTFVVKALDAATQYTDLMPACLDIEEARRDLALFEALHPVLQSINQLKELVEDTQTIAGSEAYAAARVAYSSIKTVGRSRGLDEVVSDLARQFQRTRRERSEG